jgi:hypothetical protein
LRRMAWRPGRRKTSSLRSIPTVKPLATVAAIPDDIGCAHCHQRRPYLNSLSVIYVLKRTRRDSMKNVEMQVKDGKLLITIDLSKQFGRSTTGKSVIIASTEGNASVPGNADVKIGLNVYKKP